MKITNNISAVTVQSNAHDTRNSGGQTIGKHPATGGTVAWDKTAQGAGNRKNDFLSSNRTALIAELHALLGARRNNGDLSARHVAQKNPDWVAPRARKSSANAKGSAPRLDRRNAVVLPEAEQKFQLGGVHIHMKASFAGHEADLYERMRGQLAPTKQNSHHKRESVANNLASALWKKRGASTHRSGDGGKAQFIAAATKDLLALYDARKMERYKEDGASIPQEPRKVGDMPSDGKPKGILRAPNAIRQTDKAVRFEGESDEVSKARAARRGGDTKQEAFDVNDARVAYREYVADLASGKAVGLDKLYPPKTVEKLAALNNNLPPDMKRIDLPAISLPPVSRRALEGIIKPELADFDARKNAYEGGALPAADALKKRVQQEAQIFARTSGFFKTLSSITKRVDLTETQKAVVFWRAVNEMPAQLAQAMEDAEETLEAKAGGLSPSKDVADEGAAFKNNPLTAALTTERRAFEEKWMQENIDYVKANYDK